MNLLNSELENNLDEENINIDINSTDNIILQPIEFD